MFEGVAPKFDVVNQVAIYGSIISTPTGNKTPLMGYVDAVEPRPKLKVEFDDRDYEKMFELAVVRIKTGNQPAAKITYLSG